MVLIGGEVQVEKAKVLLRTSVSRTAPGQMYRVKIFRIRDSTFNEVLKF